jgi:hypothetical protein
MYWHGRGLRYKCGHSFGQLSDHIYVISKRAAQICGAMSLCLLFELSEHAMQYLHTHLILPKNGLHNRSNIPGYIYLLSETTMLFLIVPLVGLMLVIV